MLIPLTRNYLTEAPIHQNILKFAKKQNGRTDRDDGNKNDPKRGSRLELEGHEPQNTRECPKGQLSPRRLNLRNTRFRA